MLADNDAFQGFAKGDVVGCLADTELELRALFDAHHPETRSRGVRIVEWNALAVETAQAADSGFEC